MAQGVDVKVKLAQAMADMDTQTGNDLQKMFDALETFEEDGAYSNYQPMRLFHEIIGDIATQAEPGWNVFDILETLNAAALVSSVQKSMPLLGSQNMKRIVKRRVKQIAVGQTALY